MEIGTVLVKQIDYHELEKYIRQVYGFEDPKEMFSIIAIEEWTNDSQHLFHMEKKPLNKWDQKRLDKWKSCPLGFHQYILHTILQDMVNNGHLGEGAYLITVCW